MSPLRQKMQAWVDELIQISDVVLLKKADADLFTGYEKALEKARQRQREIKEEVRKHLLFESMKSTVGGSE